MDSASIPNLVLRLRGWKAVAVLAGFLALTTVRFQREHELPPLAREAILLRLKADCSRPVLQKMTGRTNDRDSLAAHAALLEERQRVQIDRATVRGILWPKYVRVEVSVNGQPPPDGQTKRYFTLDWGGGAHSEISGFKYHLYLW